LKADIERFLEHLRVERQSASNTISAYRTDLLQFERVLAGQPGGPEPITQQAVAGYVTWLQGKGYTAATVARKMVAVRSCLGFLGVEQAAGSAELFSQLQPPPTPRKPPRVLSPEQFERLRSAPAALMNPRGQRDAAVLDLLYTTGMRASEITELDLEHLDLELGRIRVPGARDLSLPLGAARSSIRSYLESGRPQLVRQLSERALFVNLRGKRLSRQGLWLVVKRWAQMAGLDEHVSPHSLRHSMAHLWLSQGKSRRELQRTLGLSSPSAIRVRPKPRP
jgi:integrase/recombinase XerD